MTIFAPSRASHSAVVCPRPFVLPVTSAHFPASRPSVVILSPLTITRNAASFQLLAAYSILPDASLRYRQLALRDQHHPKRMLLVSAIVLRRSYYTCCVNEAARIRSSRSWRTGIGLRQRRVAIFIYTME